VQRLSQRRPLLPLVEAGLDIRPATLFNESTIFATDHVEQSHVDPTAGKHDSDELTAVSAGHRRTKRYAMTD
jgi:hypothetical protein